MVATVAFFHICVNKHFQVGTKLKNNPTLLLVVAAAMVRADGLILLQKRPEGRPMAGLWEFPGGKLEEGECPEQALVRELAEELAMNVLPESLLPCCFASAPLGSKHLLLMLYVGREWSGDPHGIEQQEIGWFSLDQMHDLEMPPADLPLIELLRNQLNG